MEDTVLYRDPTEVFNPLESEKVSNVSSLSAFLATLNQSGSGGSRLRRFLDETGSLDVNVGDSNSCRLSDISSISYTNVTQDDNESLGCETNASLDNIIDSASSCRSDEESPYELDQDDTDYGLESSGYFGNQDLFSEKPLKVDKSSMTNLAPSDDDIKNFMSPHDSIADLNSGLSAEIRRDSIKPMKSFDESLSKYHSKDKEIYESPKDETSSRETFGDSSNLDCSMKSPSFMQASSDESSMELKEIFVNKDSNNKVEFKLNGIIGTKSAISNCKGSKVTLEFYCGKNITRDKSEKIAEAKETSKFIKSGSKIDSSGLDAPEAITIQTDLTEVNKPSEGLESVSDLPHLKPVMRSQDDSKKVHLPTRIRPSPGLAKRIEESKAEVLQEAKLPADKPLPATNSEGIFSTRACSGFIKNDEMPVTSQNSISTEPKTEEKKKPSTAKALDFCNEDIESSLNEIRSILYGSRIGLAKTATQSMNSSQSITSYSKVHGVSNNFGINSLIQSVKKDLCTDINAPKDVLMPDAKMFCNSEEDNKADGAVKPEVSVIDELLEELRMSEPCFDDTQDVPQNSSPGVEMKGDLKYRHIDSHSGRAYIVNLSIPYAVEKKTFSLSPEATDCDSIDASSIISDEGKTSPSAMPVVEDGLSSEDEGREGFSEILRGNKTRKSFIIDSRSEHIPRVRKLEDKFFPTSSSGSISSVSASSSHSKQNGFSIKIKQQEKQVVRKDVKAKVKESSEMFAPHSENTKEQVDAKAVVKVERQETTKVEIDKNSDGQDIIEMKKMSEIALFQSSTKVSSTAQKAPAATNSSRIGDDDEKGLQKVDQGLGRSDSHENRIQSKLSHPGEEGGEEGSVQKVKVSSTQDSKPIQDDTNVDKKPNDATALKVTTDEKSRAKNFENERESFLIEGVLFRAQYLGSTQLVSEGQPSKATRLMQAQEAINRIKDPTLKGNPRPSTLVDLFVSVEKIMVLNTDLQEIMMDHALRTISYIADIGDVLVVMARRGPMNNSSSPGAGEPAIQEQTTPTSAGGHNQAKICCHVFESDEAQLIAQSISQAFQVAYIEFLKANGINDPDLIKEMDYQDVLSQQEIFGEELFLFSNRDMQKEVLVPKSKGEPLGMVIVESGWGSMVPTVVLANMAPGGAAARCGQLNIGDQIISVNGISLVGLPLSTCQAHLKALRNEILARFMVVSCTPVVEVLVKRPDIKYQLGFSVQNGVICSLLRGGIAERGGVRVGHRIIEINGQSVVAVPHDKIVSMLASSVGEIHMKTMQTSIYRLLTGQDTPHYI